MPLNKDLRELLGLLHSNGVEYLVVGAFAVAFHGFPRYTAALDLLVRPTAGNADRVLRALSEFGFGTVGIQAADLRSPGKVIQLGVKPNRMDLLIAISGVSFVTPQQGMYRPRERPWRCGGTAQAPHPAG
jgi:hypothetical protein